MPTRRPRPPVFAKRFLERLRPGEAEQVLRTLLGTRPDVAPVAEEIARSLLTDVSCEQVADDVEDAVCSLGFDDLDAGPTEFGYTEPGEAAWEVLEAAVAPFEEDLKRHVELELEIEALEICKGVLLGLYRLRDRRRHDVLEHAEDFPEEAAGNALETWQRTRLTGAKKRRRPGFPSDFVSGSIPAWKGLVDRVLRRRGGGR